MSYINFKPWVGKNYQNGLFGGKKILVLGESHYCTGALGENGTCGQFCTKEKMDVDCVNMTKEVIDAIKNDEWQHRTFTNFERTIFGREPSPEECEMMWDSLIFYNYLQYAQAGPTRPLNQTAEAYRDSELAFKELLETYMPDYIIAWGVRLYDIAPNWDGEPSSIEIEDNGKADVWTYTINGKKIPTLFIYHPSYPGYSWPAWHPFIKKFLGIDL